MADIENITQEQVDAWIERNGSAVVNTPNNIIYLLVNDEMTVEELKNLITYAL